MTPERLQRIDEIFQSALDLAPEQRRLFLADIHADDPELHAEVDSLLCAHDGAGAFIEAPAAEAAAALLAATPVAERIGTYTIEAPLGAGGMGEVYRAVDRMGRRVALKTLASRFVHDPKHVSRFMQEARAVLALNHPNVVTVYDIGEADGMYYIASELIEGRTLRDVMDERALTLDALLEIATQVATGVAAAHEKGIVHRDVKPENVMVRADGYVKVLDFGIAKLTESFDQTNEESARTALTREGLVIGTASYMSPEQARGANVDARSDVWSFGVMLYEMVTGTLPFSGDSAADVIGRILEREPPPLANFVVSPPSELQAIVTKALTKVPYGRFQTMQEVIASLKSLRQELVFAAKLERLTVPKQITAETPKSKPFVFVCYAHADADQVYPHIERLRADGIDLWFDRGIRAGAVWRREVGEALDRASHVLFFVSPRSLESEHCDPEVQYAIDKRKVVIPVFLERTELSSQLRVPLSRVHALYCDRMSADALHDALRDAVSNEHRAPTTASSVTAAGAGTRGRRWWLAAWAAAAAAGVIAGVLWFVGPKQLSAPPTRSIAVLPFVAMGEDPQLRHVADAFVEELLNDLAGQRQMKVASRTATSAKPLDQTLPEFVNRLGVSYVLEGSVQPTNDGNRATVQLIRGRDGQHLWSQTFEFGREIADLERIAGQIALRTFLFVDNDVLIEIARLQTKNDEAFAHYERAFRMDPSGAEPDSHEVGVAKKLANYNKAIELDPNFAEPYIERALRESEGSAERKAEARRSLARYLELRPNNARGLTLLGVMQASDGDLAVAEKTLLRACELEPDFPWPYNVLGELEMWRGHPRQAADYYRQAISNDSARPSRFNYGMALLSLGELAEADRQFEIWGQIEPDDPAAAAARVVTAKLQGLEQDARQRFDAAWGRFGKAAPEHFMTALVMMGHESELRDLMKQWNAGTRPSSPVLWFLAFNALGEYDTAIDWLLRAIDEGAVPSVRVEGLFPQLHRHPRFREVLAKLDAKDKLGASVATH